MSDGAQDNRFHVVIFVNESRAYNVQYYPKLPGMNRRKTVAVNGTFLEDSKEDGSNSE